MKLQLALDVFPLPEALALADAVADSVEIFEIGTPFLLEEGLGAVRAFRERFPEHEILADTKIMDAGELEAAAAFGAGADYVTVLAVTDVATAEGCVRAAEECGGKIVADMLCVEDLPAKIAELERTGVHGIAVHTGVDQQSRGRTPLGDLKIMKEHARSAQVFVAGGISLATLPEYAACGPDVIIVGGAIGNAAQPAQEARKIADAIRACAGR